MARPEYEIEHLAYSIKGRSTRIIIQHVPRFAGPYLRGNDIVIVYVVFVVMRHDCQYVIIPTKLYVITTTGSYPRPPPTHEYSGFSLELVQAFPGRQLRTNDVRFYHHQYEQYVVCQRCRNSNLDRNL